MGCLKGWRCGMNPPDLGGVTGSEQVLHPDRPRTPTCLSVCSVCLSGPRRRGSSTSRLPAAGCPPLSSVLSPCGLARRRSFLTIKVRRLLFSTEGWLRVFTTNRRIHFWSFMTTGGIKHTCLRWVIVGKSVILFYFYFFKPGGCLCERASPQRVFC